MSHASAMSYRLSTSLLKCVRFQGPLHKRNFRLKDGKCLNDEDFSIMPFDVKQEGNDLLVLLPDSNSLDAVIGTSKWMVKQASAELSSRGGGEGIEIAGVGISLSKSGSTCAEGQSSCSANASLDW
jgi:nitrite reductase (NAD(P)H)